MLPLRALHNWALLNFNILSKLGIKLFCGGGGQKNIFSLLIEINIYIYRIVTISEAKVRKMITARWKRQPFIWYSVSILKWLGSTFKEGLRRILHHQPMDGLLLYIYIPVLFWIKNLVNYGSNGKKNSPQKTFFELSDKIPKMIILG